MPPAHDFDSSAERAVQKEARALRRSPATEDEAAESETEPERAERKRTHREGLAPDREPLPVAEGRFLLLRQLLAAALLPQSTSGLKAEIEIVEDLGRLFGHASSV